MVLWSNKVLNNNNDKYLVSRPAEAKTSWIVPFTAGGFLHIALVTVLPELLREHDRRESLKHLAALLAGILLMALLTRYC